MHLPTRQEAELKGYTERSASAVVEIAEARQEAYEQGKKATLEKVMNAEWYREAINRERQESHEQGKSEAEATRAEWDRRRLDILEMTRQEARAEMAREMMEWVKKVEFMHVNGTMFIYKRDLIAFLNKELNQQP